MASAIFLFATALFALIATTAVHGSSNTVAITHRSSLASPAYANDGQSVSIVKERPADEEYVTDFYRRVRDKRKAFFGRQLREHDALEQRSSEDHSLDHYFDHDLAPGPRHRASSKNGNDQKWNEAGAVKTSSCAVSRVRGGGTAEMARPSSHEPFHCSAAGRGGHGDRGRHHREEDAWRGESGHPPRRHGRRGHRDSHARGVDGHHHGHRSHHAQEHSLFDDDDEEGDLFDTQDYYDELDQQGGDDYPEHHLGLLRVPCSIAINSGEASSHHHSSSHSSHPREHQGGSQGKTSMAAYVDTGAQVTVISAAAAKRAGIIHLMDRRYAGRATGVGHCRVLGRIPARHVYFILGEDDCEEDDDDYEDDFREENEANTAQMDGPALTVLEGTVTQGVDILFGLDVLQDWEAEIRVGSRKSLTVKKGRNKNGGGGSAVIPFARPARRRHVEETRTARPTRPAFVERRSHRRHHHSHSKSGGQSNHRRKAITENIVDEEEEEDDDFSPTSSDIESDLDLLDQAGHEFPEESYVDKRRFQEMEGELSVSEGEEDREGDEYEDDDFDEEDEDDEGEMDMAGF
ncbi:hypothetical protein ACHAXT_004224 [Thalassiosira profunda]